MKKKNKSNEIIEAGRGKDGTYAQVTLDSGDTLIAEEAVRQLKRGNIKSNYRKE